MAVYGKDFVYNGTSLSSIDDDFILVSFDQTEDVAHQRRINASEISNDNYITHYYGHVADTPLEFDLTITRCEGDITRADAKTLSDWLFETSEPKVMYIVPDDGADEMYDGTDFIGSFTEMRYSEDKEAITFHFINISGYAFSKPFTVEANTWIESSVLIPWVGSYTGEIIYPVVDVVPTADGTLVISLPNGTDFSIDINTEHPFRISDRNLYNEDGSLYSFENLNTFNWPYLIDGDNIWGLSGTGTAVITIQTRNLITTGY